jgi:HEAT repeat protein
VVLGQFKSYLRKKMKKLLLILVAWVIVSHSVAQTNSSDQRTSTTKIADVLALQPALTDAKLQEAYAQLQKFSVQDIAALLQGLKPQGANNAPIEYLSNSYSLHVGKGLDAVARKTFVDGALLALNQISDPYNKGYVIQLIQHAGQEEAVATLASFLQDPVLAEKSSRALAQIGTATAGEALLKALAASNPTTAIQHMDALGFMKYQPAEALLIQRLSSANDPATLKVIYAALAQLGSTASLNPLKEAAAKAKFQYDATNSLGSYLDLVFRLQKAGQLPQVATIANEIMKATSSSEQASTRAAALKLLVGDQYPSFSKVLRGAALSSDAIYRDAAYRLYTGALSSSDKKFYAGKIKKADASLQSDLIHFLVSKEATEVVPVVQNVLKSGKADVSVQKASLYALKSLQGEQAIPVLLSHLTTTQEEGVRSYTSNLLSELPGAQLEPLLLASLKDTSDPALQAIYLGLLADRGASEVTPLAFELAQKGASPEVQAAATRALASTAQPQDLSALLTLFDQQQGTRNTSLQRAITSAVDRSQNRIEAIQQVIQVAKRASAPRKQAYLGLLANLGGDDALGFVVNDLAQAESAEKQQVLRVLASWKDAGALDVLRKHIASIQDASTFDAVFKGINSQIGASGLPNDQKVLLYREAFSLARTVDQKKIILWSLENSNSFQAMQFAGQLFSDPELKETAVGTVMTISLANPQFYGEEVHQLLDVVIQSLGGGEGNYIREAVIRHKAELPTGKGFVSLFNGKDLTGWKGLVGDPLKRAKMDAATLSAAQKKADEAMRSGWYVEEGALHFNGHGDNIATIKQYGDFEMLVDWKLDAHGKEGDAGIYLRGTPQVQIWDISRVDVGAQVGSGGLYNNQKNPSKPLLVADNPLGEWNTFRILMVGDKVTVYLNGHLVTDNVVLENYWDHSSPIFPLEQLELQAHGTKVSYRDIYIKELPRKEVFQLSADEKKEGFEVLFDGTHLDHWIGNKEAYQVSEENTLAIYPTQGSGGNLYTKETYGDFVYRFDFRLTPGANNGVGIRTPLEGDAAYVGMEIQVLDDTAPVYKDLAPYQYHGSVYGIIAAKRGHLRPVGEWNTEEIYIKGNHIRITLNGVVIVDGDLEKVTKNGTLDKQQHPGLKRKDGHIAFLGHGSEVHFRHIRVKRL